MISLTAQTFDQLRQQLEQHLKVHFPETYTDFSAEEPGGAFLDAVALTGEMLSFYGDRQWAESLLTYAEEPASLYALAYQMGYRPRASVAARVKLTVLQQLPAVSLGSGSYAPDYRYALQLPAYTPVSGPRTGQSFLTEQAVDFGRSSSADPTTVTVYEQSGSVVSWYLIEKTVDAFSATIDQTTATIPQSAGVAPRVKITGEDLLGVLDVTDSLGFRWDEVQYMGQSTKLDVVPNTVEHDPRFAGDYATTPGLLRRRPVPRRFVSRLITPTSLELEFGGATYKSSDSDLRIETDAVLADSWRSSLAEESAVYGTSPAGLTMTIRTLRGGGIRANVGTGELTALDSSAVARPEGLDSGLTDRVMDSLAADNREPAFGGAAGDTPALLRQRALKGLMAQQRLVSPADYEQAAETLPARLGGVDSAYAQRDPHRPATVLLYVIGRAADGTLRPLSAAAKHNLTLLLDDLRMAAEVRLRDAEIINIGFDIELSAQPGTAGPTVLSRAIGALTTHLQQQPFRIGQPIELAALEAVLAAAPGVSRVLSITPRLLNEGEGYAPVDYDLSAATRAGVIYPSLDPSVFEVKFPAVDLRARLR